MDFPRTVYAIKHNQTNKVYVGSSQNVAKRIRAHLNQLNAGAHSVEDMQTDFERYGEDFSVLILDEISTYSERYKEYMWMIRLGSNVRGKGYNYKDYKNFAIPLGLELDREGLVEIFKKRGYTRKDIAQMLGISKKDIDNRMQSNYFYQEEISILVDKLNIPNPDEIFILPNVK